MADRKYILNCGGKEIQYSFIYPDTISYFGSFLTETTDKRCDIKIDEEYMMNHRWIVNGTVPDSYREFQCVMLATGNYLLRYKRALFHGVSFIWKNYAWIITAPSGTGKTTQYLKWHKQFKDEIQVISGDKSFIECRNDGTVWIYSSPWKGKENFGSYGRSAQLGGIIFLEQGKTNRIVRMKSDDTVLPLYLEFISYPENVDQLKNQGDILNRILNVTPVWKLTNLGDEASAALTRKTLLEYLGDMK